MKRVVAALVLAGLTGSLSACRKRAPAAAPLAAPARSVIPAVLPSGTSVSLRTVVRIAAGETYSEGFPAVLVSDLRGSPGQLVAISGSPARLVVLNTDQPQIGLAAIMVNGEWRAVAARSGTRSPVGGGSPLGTLIRGVIESLPGHNPLDAPMAIRTSGDNLQVPARALLIFRLDEPAVIE